MTNNIFGDHRTHQLKGTYIKIDLEISIQFIIFIFTISLYLYFIHPLLQSYALVIISLYFCDENR